MQRRGPDATALGRVALLWLLAAVGGACDDASLSTRPCEGAAVVEAEGRRYCIYGEGLVQDAGAAFRCPDSVPRRIDLADGTAVCADHDVASCGLPRAVCDLLGGTCCPDGDASAPELDAGTEASIGADAGAERPDAERTDAERTDADGADAGETDAESEDAGSTDGGPCTPMATVTITGEDAVADSILFGGACDTDRSMNAGESGGIQAAHAPWACYWTTSSVIRTDLGSVPSDATVVSATLRFYVLHECSVSRGDPNNCGSYDGTWDVTFNPLRRAWVESEVSWLQASAAERWRTDGALDPTADYRDTPSETLTLVAGEESSFVELDVTTSVAAFVAGTIPNHGWILRSPQLPSPATRSVDLASSEHPDLTFRPALTVIYERACE